MASVKESVTPASEFTYGACVQMCGMCPGCIFAPKPPESTRCRWEASDTFKRRFLVGLVHRCTNIRDLESIERTLSATSWTWFIYSRSGRPAAAAQRATHGSCPAPRGNPAECVDLKEIWSWFNDSPDWMKSSYLGRVLSFCDMELLRMLSNYTRVLLIRHKQGLMQPYLKNPDPCQQFEEPDEPAFMVVPGSSKSVSGVSKYRDFILCLPVYLSKKILGLLDDSTLRCCRSVCQYWQHLAKETLEEIKLRRIFNNQITAIMESCCSNHIVSPSFADFARVPVPLKDEEEETVHSVLQKVMPFQDAYAKIKTKTVQMEERNVYCGAYFTEVLLNQEDKYRVLDYKGGLMAMSSKNCSVHLLHVASETKTVAVLKEHVGMVRAVLLCEDRDLLITAGCDARIRCWNMKTDSCDMVLCGHTSTVYCLDVHDDRLVSGGKDCTVRVWSLHSGRHFQNLNFKHPSCVWCVKINRTTVYSSCDQGMVKIWNMENASLLRVINAHKSSVKCLFVDEWHLLSGDTKGKVKAWSISCEAAGCLMTFNHTKEVKSLTLAYLRVITGCSDGMIYIFNFLTGDCLRDITLGSESSPLLSLHFHDHRILVNTKSSVQLCHFAKVTWNYTDPAQGDTGNVGDQDGLVSKGSAGIVRKLPHISREKFKVTPLNRKRLSSNNLKPVGVEFAKERCLLATPIGVCSEAHEQSVIQSEKAACERMKKRGPHHPLTRDAMLLRAGANQRALRVEEVSINMENNARLRDSWGPWDRADFKQIQQQPSCVRDHRAKSCLPKLKRTVSQNLTTHPQRRKVSTAPDSTEPHCVNTRRAVKRTGELSRCATVGPHQECFTEDGAVCPASRLSKGLRGLKLFPVTHPEDSFQSKTKIELNFKQKHSKNFPE